MYGLENVGDLGDKLPVNYTFAPEEYQYVWVHLNQYGEFHGCIAEWTR